jgi:hypothetical protein
LENYIGKPKIIMVEYFMNWKVQFYIGT